MSLNLGSSRSKTDAAKDEKRLPEADDSSWSETARIIIHALLIAFVVRVFLFQPFNIPSGSMKSTLPTMKFMPRQAGRPVESRWRWSSDVTAPTSGIPGCR